MKQNFIELITVPFQAGESRLFAISGQYFELIDATDPVDVLLSDVNGAQRGVMRAAEASFNLKNTDFSTVQLTSATTQTIRFAYGSGEAGTRRAAGAVSIVGDVGLSPATLAALESIDLNPATLNTLTRPFGATGNYKESLSLASDTPQTVFTPAANTNGAILLTAYINHRHTTLPLLSFLAKASAPANSLDGEVMLFSGYTGSDVGGATGYGLYGVLQEPQFIPAGLGLYFIAGGGFTAGNANARACRYRLL